MCGGDALLEPLLSGSAPGLVGLLALLAGKYAYTTVCFGSGAPGGTLFPLVVLGALVGAVFASACAPLGLDATFLPNFVALGVAGLFSGVVRAPVTAVVLVFELTGSLDALLSVCIVSIVAYVASGLTKTDAFYEHLLAGLLDDLDVEVAAGPSGGEKDLGRARVGWGSHLEGMLVREVPWPDGLRLVTIERAGTELVPTGDTELCAMDELLFIADEDALEDARLKLRLMCAPRVRE